MVEIHQTAEWRQHHLNGFGSEAIEPEMNKYGSDLYIDTFYPDDILLLAERLSIDEETDDVSNEMVIARQTLLTIMTEFFEDGEDFHIHTDAELRAFVKDTIKAEIARATPGEQTVSDGLLNAVLAPVKGFPPYSYESESEATTNSTDLLPAA